MTHRPLFRNLTFLLIGMLLMQSPSAAGTGSVPDARAEVEGRVIIFSANGYMPFCSSTAGASPLDYDGSGMFVDLLDAFEKEHPDCALRRVLLPRARINTWLSNGFAAAYSLHSPLFNILSTQGYVFSIPIWTTADYVYTLKDSDLRCERPEDLCGVQLGIIRGFGYGPLDPLLESGVIPHLAVDTDLQLYELLLGGRIQAIVANKHVLPYSMHRYGLDPAQLRVAGPPLYEFELSTVVRRDEPELLQTLNAFIRASQKNGLLKCIEERWVGADPSLH